MIVTTHAVYRGGKVEFSKPDEAPPDGTPVVIQYDAPRKRSFRSHSGVLSEEQAKQILAAIEDGCEGLDQNEW